MSSDATKGGPLGGILGDVDLIQPDFVEKLLSALMEDPDAVVSFGNYWVVNDAGAIDVIKTSRLNRHFEMHIFSRGCHSDCEVLAPKLDQGLAHVHNDTSTDGQLLGGRQAMRE
jgi:hypothetical protein